PSECTRVCAGLRRVAMQGPPCGKRRSAPVPCGPGVPSRCVACGPRRIAGTLQTRYPRMRPALPLAIALGTLLSVATPAVAQDAQSTPEKPADERGQPADADGGAPAAADHPANAPGARGDDALLRAQVLLERARFSPGEIDGRGGTNTGRAIAAFQRSRDLEPTGELDEATWKALDGDTAPVLVHYTITGADVAGPFNE